MTDAIQTVRTHAIHWTSRHKNGGPVELSPAELSALMMWVREYLKRTRRQHAEAAVDLGLPYRLSTPLNFSELVRLMAIDGLDVELSGQREESFAALARAAEGPEATSLEFDGYLWTAMEFSPLRLASPTSLRIHHVSISGEHGADVMVTRLACVRDEQTIELTLGGFAFPSYFAWSHLDLYELAQARGSRTERSARELLAATSTGRGRFSPRENGLLNAIRKAYGEGAPDCLHSGHRDRQPLAIEWPVLAGSTNLLVEIEGAPIARVSILGDSLKGDL